MPQMGLQGGNPSAFTFSQIPRREQLAWPGSHPVRLVRLSGQVCCMKCVSRGPFLLSGGGTDYAGVCSCMVALALGLGNKRGAR